MCTGVRGFSYSWSQDSPSTPDTLADPSITTTVTTTTTTTVDSQTFPNATWPAGWTRSDATYVRLTNAAGRNHGTYAAEMWANNNTTRRTVNFYRDYDLTGFTSAVSGLLGQRLGASAPLPTTLVSSTPRTAGPAGRARELGRPVGAAGWQARNYALPVGGTRASAGSPAR